MIPFPVQTSSNPEFNPAWAEDTADKGAEPVKMGSIFLLWFHAPSGECPDEKNVFPSFPGNKINRVVTIGKMHRAIPMSLQK
jgi:hypothetical protein